MFVISIERAEATDNRYIVSGKAVLGIYSKTVIDMLQEISNLKINNFVVEFEDYDFYKLCCILTGISSCIFSNEIVLIVNDGVAISYELKKVAEKYYNIHY